MNRLDLANSFVEQYKKEVKTAYRPKFHVIPPFGWMNDPNGFSYYNGEYHLFYQYHPYFSKWGPMHWAHVKSKDLVNWEWLPIALAPDKDYDKDGCFSGTGIVDGDRHVLMYTSHLHPDADNTSLYIQQQCMAYSNDGVNYTKSMNNPVISTKMVPKSGDHQDFRDPKILKAGDLWYSLIANRNVDGSGQILVYKSTDLENWTYHGILCRSCNQVGEMWECPDVFQVDGKDVFTISPMYLPQKGDAFSNIYSAVYFIGELDLEKPEFAGSDFYEIDYGLDFYAPQSVETPDGRRIMIGWMQTWERNYPTDDMKHGWACSMTLPRELSIADGRLVQKPARELRAYRSNHVNHKNIELNGSLSLSGIEGNALELDLSVDLKKSKSLKIQLLKSNEESVDLTYSGEEKTFTFSRANTKTKISGWEDHQVESRTFHVDVQDKIRLQIFVDVSTVEVFVEGGKYVSSSTVFPLDRGTGVEIHSDGLLEIESIDKWDIGI